MGDRGSWLDIAGPLPWPRVVTISSPDVEMVIGTRQLLLVRAVAEEGTLTRASRRLLVTQSALSHQLRKLEKRVGAPIFRRSAKRMLPTAAGERILATARSVLSELDALEQDVGRIARGGAGTLRITTQCYTAYHWIPTIFPQFRERHPGVDLQIVPDSSESAIEALHAGKVDLVLAYDFERSDALAAQPLFVDDLVLVVAPGHRYAGRAFVEATDFADQHLLTHRDNPDDSLFYQSVLVPAGVRPRHVSEMRLTEGILALVAADAGVAVMTRWTAAPDIAAGRVIAVPVGRAGLERTWHAVTLPDMAEMPFVSAFVELLGGGPAGLFRKAPPPVREAARIRVIA